MATPDTHTLTGPYVLDALPADEQLSFEQHLTCCSSCTTEVGELREAAVRLSVAVASPPPRALKARVMAAPEHVRQLPPTPAESMNGPLAASPRRGLGRRSLLALAAAALAVAATGGIVIDQYQAHTSRHDRDQVTAILAESDARTTRADVTGGGQATVVLSSHRDAAVVVLRGLQPLSSRQTYQLWLIGKTQTARSVGFVDGDADRDWSTVVTGEDAGGAVFFGVTVEPEGGSTQPTLPAAVMVPVV